MMLGGGMRSWDYTAEDETPEALCFAAAAPPMAFAETQVVSEIESVASDCECISMHFQATETTICSNFEIPRKGSIPSDDSEHKVNVGIVELQPIFEYETVPSKSPHAYLKSKVTNNSSYPFLPGSIAVFLDNNFVAKVRY